MTIENTERKLFKLAAIDQVLDLAIPKPLEKESGKGFVSIGSDNRYLEYLYSLYNNVTLVKTCIDLSTDYTVGDAVEGLDEDLFRNVARDYFTYGGFAVNVLRNKLGGIAASHYLPFYRVRTNEDNTQFWYSKDWTKSYGRVRSTVYPAFRPDATDPSSILYFNPGVLTYPVAPWASAVEAAEMQKRINQFHLNSLANSFQGSYIISFNNGIPEDSQKDEIERYVNEKFAGTENAGRIVINFAQDKEHSVEVTKLETQDYGTKYQDLKLRSQEEILRAFRLNGRLIGDNTDSTGFTSSEFNDAFQLFNRTVIKPVQKQLIKALQPIASQEITIKPFTLDDESTTIKENIQ